MRRGFKPYSKRKPFKRKKGGAKFMLGSTGAGTKFEFPMHLRSGAPEVLTNLIRLILGQKRIQTGIRTGDR